MIFLQNALGFFIQLFPCVLMIFLPFPREAYRFRRKWVFASITAGTAILAAVFSAVLCLRDTSVYPKHVVISNTFMSLAVLLALAAYVWIVRQPLMKKLLVFSIVLFYAVTEYTAVNVIYELAYPLPDTMEYPYTGRFLMLYALTTALLMPLMLGAVIRPLREYIQLIEPQSMRREFAVTVCSTFAYLAVTVCCSTSFGRLGLLQYFNLPLVFMTLNQILIYWLVFRESVRRRLDGERRQTLELQQLQQQLQYEKIVGDMETTRQMHHDLRHHYNSLIDMLEQGKLEEMRSYLSQVAATTVKRDAEVYCGNIVVNGLLQYYAGIARDEGIRCDIQAECGDLQLESVDLTTLFGNAMENAINACKKCPSDRWISVHIGTVQGSLAIEISNSCQGVRLDRRYQAADGFSPAEAFLSDRDGGGYGLRSIDRTAQKYGGSAQFRFNAEKQMFTTRVRLNMHADP